MALIICICMCVENVPPSWQEMIFVAQAVEPKIDKLVRDEAIVVTRIDESLVRLYHAEVVQRPDELEMVKQLPARFTHRLLPKAALIGGRHAAHAAADCAKARGLRWRVRLVAVSARCARLGERYTARPQGGAARGEHALEKARVGQQDGHPPVSELQSRTSGASGAITSRISASRSLAQRREDPDCLESKTQTPAEHQWSWAASSETDAPSRGSAKPCTW
eukprot:CAMPEP_0181221022 /NCGR_PEP_ID=MMETSP1096-20121128/29160_1 /TAXON_ID=156174 ORGANISM="Chrysochromulina ericina, Strain CCMP281" /NCGR_SAMPLE_ID=MMETSP1096 /ASSEMBLY_ACC=CAM_ASM_000453 /LENGTH=220 /DNA_ID=CAMNT_0023313587 /DNA_START=40 /DNA_END=700 /DNA_ORIENTATION=-